MNKYSQEKETEIVRDAMTLTAAIQIEQEELARLKSERFKSMPTAPTRKVLDVPKIEAQIPPPPKTKYRFSDYLSETTKKIREKIKDKSKIIVKIGIALILFFIAISIVVSKTTDRSGMSVFFGIIFITVFSVLHLAFLIAAIFIIATILKFIIKKNETNQQLAQSPEYLNSIEEAKRIAFEKQQNVKYEVEQKQAQIDAKYNSDLEYYNTVTVPNYNKELNAWNEKQAKKMNALEEDMALNEKILESLYNTTRIISKTYRDLWILRWLYDDMNSSDHDIRYATDLLDRDRQLFQTKESGRMVKEAIDEMHSSMISGFHAVYDAIETGNEELAKMRRDQNIANAINIAQRYNLEKTAEDISKFTKDQLDMMNKYFNKK